jgi:hypothetical protein
MRPAGGRLSRIACAVGAAVALYCGSTAIPAPVSAHVHAGGDEPERPVPMLTLAAGPATPHQQNAASPQSKSSDATARLLAGEALMVAAVGAGLVLLRRRA